MAAHALTDMAIRNVALPERGQVEIWDSRIAGFGIRVSAQGTKSFVLVYRFQRKSRRLTLGRYPTLSLADARKMAAQALRQLALGSDPASDRIQKQAENPSLTPSVVDAVDEYIDKYARPKNKDWATTRDILRREYVGVWRDRALNEISSTDVMSVIDGVVSRSSTATGHNRFVYARHFFDWCVGRGYITVSPMAKLKPPPKARDRDRVLTEKELSRVIGAAHAMQYPYGVIVRILILTAQRRNEVSGMCWSEIDPDAREWSLTADRTKSSRQHVVPLTQAVWDMLCDLPRVHEAYVFPARGKNCAVSGFSKWKRTIDELSGVTDWRLHDLRRTAATGMARLGVAPHVIERILNHNRGTFGGVAGVYNRFGYLPEMRAALEVWADFVQSLHSQP
jgi:integrase